MVPYVKIREIRIEKNMTQIKLARKAGISQSYLSELESNKKSPTLRQLCKIAEALGVMPGELVYYTQKVPNFSELCVQSSTPSIYLFTGDAEMISNKNTKVTTVIPKEVYKKLIEEASYEDRSVSNMIAKILK
jgi:transcriptional regulator with XRE-family HTH domain